MQSREAELEAMLSQAQTSLLAMQKLYTGAENQLFAIQTQSEEERMGRQAELEVAFAELERAQVDTWRTGPMGSCPMWALRPQELHQGTRSDCALELGCTRQNLGQNSVPKA